MTQHRSIRMSKKYSDLLERVLRSNAKLNDELTGASNLSTKEEAELMEELSFAAFKIAQYLKDNESLNDEYYNGL